MDYMSSAAFREVSRLLSAVQRKDSTFFTSLRTKTFSRMLKVMFDCPEKPENFDIMVSNPITYPSICLTSGGADSTICWHRQGKPQGLYIDIGQDYAWKEIDALNKLEIPFIKLDLSTYGFTENTWKHIIPGRNLLFLTLAAELVTNTGSIYFSVIEGEGYFSKKGDKSKLFINEFTHWYKELTGKIVYVETMQQKTKGQWLSWFKQWNNIDEIRYKTVTCFNGDAGKYGQCGRCQACLRKFLSFASIGMNIYEDFDINPVVGCTDYIAKYKEVLPKALKDKDFSHYSENRCIEDLEALDRITRWNIPV